MLAFCQKSYHRLILCVAAAAGLTFHLAQESAAQPLLVGPALPGNPVEAESPAEPLVDKRKENAEQLRLAQRKLDTSGATDSAATQEVAYYQMREAVLAQQEAVEQQIKDLESRKTELDTQLKTPPNSDKKWTFIELDRLKDDLAAEQSRATLVADKVASAKANVEKAQAALDESEVRRKQAQEALEGGKEGPKIAELAAAAKRAEQEAELAAETLALRKREVERERLTQEVLQLNLQVHKDQVSRISPTVTFSESDYQEQIEDIKKNEETATAALTSAQDGLRTIELQRRETKQQLDQAEGADRAVLTEKFEAQRRLRQRLSEEIDSQIQRLQQLAELRLAWSRRYQIASANQDTTDSEVFSQLKSQQKETKAVLVELTSALRNQIFRMRDLRNSLTSVAKKASAAAKGPTEVLSWIEEQQRQLDATLRIYEKNLVSIEASRRVHEKLLDEISDSVKALTPKTIALGAWYQAAKVWNHPLVQINKEWITVGMAVKGLTTLALGWLLSRFVSATVAYRILKRFRLSKDATTAIRSLVFYLMLAGVTLSALHTVNVDLTAFTILGGALAIGVGFGSQALINNFIGGLIMLAERPVRLGEQIKFGNLDRVVEDVGFRCTKLRTNTDHLVTIPNSSLVNESIENIDRRRTIRRQVNIPVTYNVSRNALEAAVQAIRDILEEKEIRERIHPIVGFEEFLPRVFFSEFAAESLNIQIVYWYAPVDWWAYMEHSERVNFRLMEVFEQMGIEFAFPSKTSYVKNAKKSGTGRETGTYAA